MLKEATLSKLQQLGLVGILGSYEEQQEEPATQSLSFDERLGMLLDREITYRSDLRLRLRLKGAHLKQGASIEDINFRTPRGIEKSVILSLSSCDFIRRHQSIIITGPTGTGKTYLACALAHKACREGFQVRYYRLTRLFEELKMGRGDGRHPKILTALNRFQLLILDDFGLAPLDADERHDLLEIFEDRYRTHTTIITTQLPIKHWHEMIGDETIADAILDRIVHQSHKIELQGSSMRKEENGTLAL